jgi:hypothetical protein
MKNGIPKDHGYAINVNKNLKLLMILFQKMI